MGVSGLSGSSGLSALVPSGPPLPDPDAAAFIAATGITDQAQRTAIEVLVQTLKAVGTWDKYIFIYPIVGGTADTHKYNLKDPRDLPAALRVAWQNGVSHSAAGVVATQTLSFGHTQYSGPVACMGLYTRSSLAVDDVGMGWINGDSRAWIHPRWVDEVSYCDLGTIPFLRSEITRTGPIGHVGFSYTPGQDFFGIFNGEIPDAVPTNPPNVAIPTGNVVSLMGPTLGDNYLYSDRTYSFFYLANSLTRAEMIAGHNAIQEFQTALGRAA